MRISYWSSDVCSSDLLADPGDPSWLYPLGLNKQKFNNFSFRVGAEYHFDRDIMAYASYATAFKAGGWTTRLTGPLFDTTTLQPLPAPTFGRSEEHTSELQSLMLISYAVFCLKTNTATFLLTLTTVYAYDMTV